MISPFSFWPTFTIKAGRVKEQPWRARAGPAIGRYGKSVAPETLRRLQGLQLRQVKVTSRDNPQPW